MTRFSDKSRVASTVWQRCGDSVDYVEPFAGSLAVMLQRPGAGRNETVNDIDCVAPETKLLRSDLTWCQADEVRVGDNLLGFNESNGEAREGLRVPKRSRRLRKAVVTNVKFTRKPCYRLTFTDGTSVVCSKNHLWLGGSHKTGGRGWRWVPTKNMVCNRKMQRSCVLKVADVVTREESWEAAWVEGFSMEQVQLRLVLASRSVLTE